MSVCLLYNKTAHSISVKKTVLSNILKDILWQKVIIAFLLMRVLSLDNKHSKQNKCAKKVFK